MIKQIQVPPNGVDCLFKPKLFCEKHVIRCSPMDCPAPQSIKPAIVLDRWLGCHARLSTPVATSRLALIPETQLLTYNGEGQCHASRITHQNRQPVTRQHILFNRNHILCPIEPLFHMYMRGETGSDSGDTTTYNGSAETQLLTMGKANAMPLASLIKIVNL